MIKIELMSHRNHNHTTHIVHYKRWDVWREQTHLGILKWNMRDQIITFVPDQKVETTEAELTEIVRIMCSVAAEEKKILVQ